MRKIIIYVLFVSLAVSVLSCEYYLGYDQQPKFEKQNIEQGLNVFGMLRPDSVYSYNKSFVYVNRLMPVMEPAGFNILKDADVRIERIVNDELAETVRFPLVPSGSFFADTMYRPIMYFSPQPGDHYRMVCRYQELPDAVGETTFPPEPLIKENSLSVNGRVVSFTLVADSLIGMVDVYRLTGQSYVPLMRLIPSAVMDTDVKLNLGMDPDSVRLALYSYDQNMAVYNGNSNISLNFNKFRTTITTLESGYGVFGAMNFTIIDLTEE